MKFIKQNWFILALFLFSAVCFVCMYLDLSHLITELDKSFIKDDGYQEKYNAGMKAANAQVLKEGLDYEEIANADRYIKSIRTNRR